MVKLESRPARHEKWSYVFFADFEGHIQDPRVKTTIDEMRNICLFLKFLGSYPRARDGF
jgi:chorismate mutase/prephenate dehydratase